MFVHTHIYTGDLSHVRLYAQVFISPRGPDRTHVHTYIRGAYNMSTQQDTQQLSNGFLPGGGMSDTPPSSSTSHDSHMTNNNITTGSSDGSECAIFDQSVLVEDPFYNFDELGQSSAAVQSILDPHNPNAIPFFDDCFGDSLEDPGGSNFDPDLFNSILSTGDDLLARLESTSSSMSGGGGVASFELPLDERMGVGGGVEVGVAGEAAFSPESPILGMYFSCFVSRGWLD